MNDNRNHLITGVERRFRESEQRLDGVLSRDGPALEAAGITVNEFWNGREYHYQNERLSWNFQFEIKRARGSEIEKVWARVTLREEEPESVAVWWRAEIFQTGKQSRWSITNEDVLSLDEIERIGLANLVIGIVKRGLAAAAAAV